jgi:hypothetical protein
MLRSGGLRLVNLVCSLCIDSNFIKHIDCWLGSAGNGSRKNSFLCANNKTLQPKDFLKEHPLKTNGQGNDCIAMGTSNKITSSELVNARFVHLMGEKMDGTITKPELPSAGTKSEGKSILLSFFN